MLGVNAGEHAFWFQRVAEAARAGRVTYYAREDRPQGRRQRLRGVGAMPLNASLRVHCLAGWETV
jgi:hypothetical protein